MAKCVAAGVRDKDNLGLLWDREAVAFYGDPAWEVRVARAGPPTWEQVVECTEEGNDAVGITLTVTATTDGELPRPVVAFLQCRVMDVRKDPRMGQEIVACGDFFVVWLVKGKLRAGESQALHLKARKQSAGSK